MARDPLIDISLDRGGADMPVLQEGQFLFNRRYELVGKLGAGGMGVVWLARDHTEETQVALKFLPAVLVQHEAEMKRLKEEVRAGKELRHPGIVATYALELEGSTAAIVMEYVEGKTLAELLEAQARSFFEPQEITGWTRDIADAVDYLHRDAKRIHRDLKPANILVDAAGRARLMDFGISRRVQESVTRHSRSSVVPALGGSEIPAEAGTTKQDSSATLAYASPQQLAGKPAHPADDLYSLGALLYELLTGTPPFFRGNADEVRGQIKHEPVTPLTERRTELVSEGLNASVGEKVPAAVEKAILACLEKEREKRPANAKAVCETLVVKSGPLTPVSGTQSESPSKNTQSTHSPRGSSGTSVASSPRVPLRGLSGPLWAAAALVIVCMGVWAIFSQSKKTVEDTAAKQEAARQKQRADELEEKAKDEEQKRLVAEAATAKAKAEAAKKAAMPLPAPPKSPTLTATQESPFTNFLGMKFVPVPINAGPSKDQRILFSIWETRSKDYAAFVKDSGHDAGEKWRIGEYNGVPVGRGEGERAEDSTHPVAFVSHDDAVAFCAWLTKKERASGQIGPQDEYRLPSDVEWSYAVGIGDKEDASASPKDKRNFGILATYPWGTQFPPPKGCGNYADSSAKDAFGGNQNWRSVEGYTDNYSTTAPVGSFHPNPWGIYDIGGNLWEWTDTFYEQGESYFALRGSSWSYFGPPGLFSSLRDNASSSSRGEYIGFRCVIVRSTQQNSSHVNPASNEAALKPFSIPSSATKESPFINSLGMKFVPVPIGAGPSKGQRILFSIWETRSKDYAAFVKDSGHDAGEDWRTENDNGVPVGRGENEKAEESSHPVANVSHDDAVVFCAWLTKKDRASGQIGPQDEYRLPSDVEWSYAVGIGYQEDASASPKDKDMKIAGVYPWGSTYPLPPGSGNYPDMTARAKGTAPFTNFDYTDSYATTAPVGSFKANALGLHDLGGNLCEWTSSLDESGSAYRVLRGASWCYYDTSITLLSHTLSSNRSMSAASNRYSDYGFRCVLAVSGR